MAKVNFNEVHIRKYFLQWKVSPKELEKNPLTEPFEREGPKYKGSLSYPHRELATQILLITLTYLCDKEEKQKLIKYLFSYSK